jgi:hypothetical protein
VLTGGAEKQAAAHHIKSNSQLTACPIQASKKFPTLKTTTAISGEMDKF